MSWTPLGPSHRTARDDADAPRVAVLTFHFHYNYGGVLQAYGLQHALRSLGYEAVFPSTVPRHCRGWIDLLPLRSSRRKGLLGAWIDCREEFPRRWAFDRFRRDHFPAASSGPTWSEAIADPRTVACVVGGDQVWNLSIMGRWDPYYFLGSLPVDSRIRRVGYGACFGTAAQPPDHLRLAAPLLSRFSSIGTRGDTTARIVEKVTGRKTTPVVDPALLHDYREVRGTAPFESGFILFFGKRPETMGRGREIALAVRRRTGLPIVLIVPETFAAESRPAVDWADRVESRSSPADWLESIRRCSHLVTDSFHACLFAMAHRRPFLAYGGSGTEERILDVTRRYGLDGRVVAEGVVDDPADLMSAPIDFDAVHEKLRVDRATSMRFLADALAGRSLDGTIVLAPSSVPVTATPGIVEAAERERHDQAAVDRPTAGGGTRGAR